MTTVLDPPRARPALDAPARPGMGFRPDVEGLRAVGILLVVAFHATVPGMAGGYVGVDVFFVISGFLITGLLTREGLLAGRISLQDFFARRARRILPAACVVIAVTAVVLSLFVDPLREYRSVLDLAAALFYVSNWRFINQDNDYLAASNDQSPALHFWSLSVEEQFYLVWPLLIVLAVVLARRYRLDLRLVAAVVLSTATVASLWASLVLTVSDPNLAYMATYARAWQFGVGGLVALLVMEGVPRLGSGPAARRLLAATGLVGAGMVVTSALVLDGATAYPGTAALVPTVGAAAIIFAGSGDVTRSTWSVSALLSARPVRWMGRMSYAWYLWHWPVIVLVEARWPGVPLVGRVAAMGLALLLAWATNRLLERPMVSSRRLRRRRSVSYGAVALVTLAAGLALATVGTEARTDLRSDTARAVQVAASSDFETVFGGPTEDSGPVTPAPGDADQDLPRPYSCLIADGLTSPDRCLLNPAGERSAVLLGDSHAFQWLTPLREVLTARGYSLQVSTRSGCSVAQLPVPDGASDQQRECLAWRDQQLDAIAQARPDLVVVASSNRYVGESAVVDDGWRRTLVDLEGSGADVIYLRDTPFAAFDVPECVSGHLDAWRACAVTEASNDNAEFARREVAAVAPFENVRQIDMLTYLCEGQVCPAVRNGVLMFRDSNHVSDTAARIMRPALARELSEAGVLAPADREPGRDDDG